MIHMNFTSNRHFTQAMVAPLLQRPQLTSKLTSKTYVAILLWPIKASGSYRGAQNGVQSIVVKDPHRSRQKSLARAGTNFTTPGALTSADLSTNSREVS